MCPIPVPRLIKVHFLWNWWCVKLDPNIVFNDLLRFLQVEVSPAKRNALRFPSRSSIWNMSNAPMHSVWFSQSYCWHHKGRCWKKWGHFNWCNEPNEGVGLLSQNAWPVACGLDSWKTIEKHRKTIPKLPKQHFSAQLLDSNWLCHTVLLPDSWAIDLDPQGQRIAWKGQMVNLCHRPLYDVKPRSERYPTYFSSSQNLFKNNSILIGLGKCVSFGWPPEKEIHRNPKFFTSTMTEWNVFQVAMNTLPDHLHCPWQTRAVDLLSGGEHDRPSLVDVLWLLLSVET